jgi:hypothetical protein
MDSQPTTFDTLLDSGTSLYDAQSEGVNLTENEGASHLTENEGASPNITENEGDSYTMDPLTGNDLSPHHLFSVNFDASLQMPESINFAEAGLRRSSRQRKPTDHLISNQHFGLGAVRKNRANRFDIRTKLLRAMSFMSLQIHHREFTQMLDDGTANFSHPLAFATTLADNETFHYGDAMKQPNKSSFLHAMIKEVNDLSNSGVWIL